MTKLTKQSRLDIIESVIKNTNIPAKKEALIAKVGPKVREAIRKLLPKMFENTVEHLPATWICTMNSVRILINCNPEAILDGYYSQYSSREVDFQSLKIPALFLEMNEIKHTISAGANNPDNKLSWEKILEKEIAAAKVLRKKEVDLRYELSAFLASMSTHAQVIAKMPEIERHLPVVPGKEYPIVVSVTKLTNLLDGYGFDQGAK